MVHHLTHRLDWLERGCTTAGTSNSRVTHNAATRYIPEQHIHHSQASTARCDMLQRLSCPDTLQGSADGTTHNDTKPPFEIMQRSDPAEDTAVSMCQLSGTVQDCCKLFCRSIDKANAPLATCHALAFGPYTPSTCAFKRKDNAWHHCLLLSISGWLHMMQVVITPLSRRQTNNSSTICCQTLSRLPSSATSKSTSGVTAPFGQMTACVC